MLRIDSLFSPTRIYVEIVLYIKSFYRHLGIYFLLVPALIVLGRKIQMGIPFGDSPLLSLVPRNYFHCDSCWNFPAGASELIPFGARSDRFCYSRSPKIPSWGFLLVFPRWDLPELFHSLGTLFPPVGGLLLFSFLGELHQSPKWKIAYVPLGPFANYIHMLN